MGRSATCGGVLRLDVPGLTEQVREAIAQVGAVPAGEQGAPA